MRIVKRVALMAIVCLLLLAGSASAQTNPAIIAGQSVAGIRIGSTVNDAISTLGGLFDRGDSRSGRYSIYDWPLRPLVVLAEKDSGRVVLIAVSFTDAYRTDRGITGGTERQAVEAAYGREFTTDEDQSSTTLLYDALGIAFDIGKQGAMNGRVVRIFVFPAGQWKDITDGL